MSGHKAYGFALRFLPSIFLLLFIVGYIATSYLTLDLETRRVPLLAAYLTLFLLVCEIFPELSPKSATRKSNDSSGLIRSEDVPSLAQEATVLLSVVGLALGIYLAGFYVAVPLYLVVTIGYFGRQSMRLSLAIALITTLGVYLAFDRTLGYQLFPGILLS